MPLLASKEICTGCSACSNICSKKCIKMIDDIDGYAYPVISNQNLCVNCGMCEKICPVLKNNDLHNEVLSVYAAYTLNESNRLKSSSGGIFSEMAMAVFESQGVVFGAAYDKSFKVKHIRIEKSEDIEFLYGAKYSQSILGDIFLQVQNELCLGKMVLFSGTPCQVAGLKSFLKREYINLLTVDFVCHGVPSPMVWKAYVEYRANEDANGEFPKTINLRSKSTGWSKYQYSNVFEYKNGKKKSISNAESLFMKLFVSNYISRPSCENCKFKGYSRVSDVTLGDFWGIWDIDPEMDDNKGTSVVLVQSQKGESLWNEIRDKVKYKGVTLEQASQQNPSMLISSKANPNRKAILDKIREGRIAECESLFVVPKASISSRIKGKIKRLMQRG